MKKLLALLLLLFPAPVLLAQTLSEKYILVKESDGQVPKTGAVISITFNKNGSFALIAKMPGATVTDKGSYKISGSNISISFNEMEQGKQSGYYSLEDGTLILPFKMLKNVKGSSTWQQEGTTASNTAISTLPVTEIITKWLNYASRKLKLSNDIDQAAAVSAKKINTGLATGYYTQGTMLFFKKYYMAALYAFAKAAQLESSNTLYLNNFAMLLMEMDQYGDAITILEDLTKTAPKIASPWGNLAIAYFFTGNLPAAENAINKAISNDALCGSYYYTEGVIAKKKGNTEKAQQSFDKAWENGYAGKGREGSPAAKNKNATPNKNKVANNKPVPAPKKSNSQTKSEKIALWEGHYEAQVVSAKSGETAAEANTQFGKDMYQTNINLVTTACVKSFSMEISKLGNITGSGEIMYVYRGGAVNAVANMSGLAQAYGGGFKTNLKNGFQLRTWNFSGSIDENGNIELNGLPSEKLDLYNTGEWQKITPWSPLKPDAAGAAMKGPFHLLMTEGKDGKHFAQLDDYLALNDKLIKKVHYQTLIIKSNDKLIPDCQAPAAAPEANPCPASEFIKTKVALTQNDHITVESSKTYSKDANGNMQVQSENAVNVSSEFSAGMATGSAEFHTDGSFECTLGIGLSTPDFKLKGAEIKASEKLELIYDSKCGFGVKGSAAAKANVKHVAEGSASVEAVIFFNKGL